MHSPFEPKLGDRSVTRVAPYKPATDHGTPIRRAQPVVQRHRDFRTTDGLARVRDCRQSKQSRRVPVELEAVPHLRAPERQTSLYREPCTEIRLDETADEPARQFGSHDRGRPRFCEDSGPARSLVRPAQDAEREPAGECAGPVALAIELFAVDRQRGPGHAED